MTRRLACEEHRPDFSSTVEGRFCPIQVVNLLILRRPVFAKLKKVVPQHMLLPTSFDLGRISFL